MLAKLTNIIIFALMAFFVALAMYPMYIKFLRRIKAGKQIREHTMLGEKSEIFSKMHEHKK